MARLIDKDALLAEIERRQKEEVFYNEDGSFTSCGDQIHYSTLESLKNLINSIEVKEVDLDYIKKELDEVVRIYKPTGHFGWGTLYNVATHFYELGLKAQKG